MTQRQLDIVNFRFDAEQFQNVQSSQSEVICELSERYSVIVKRHKSAVYILIKSGKKCLKLPTHIFDALCNAQITVSYLKTLLAHAIE